MGTIGQEASDGAKATRDKLAKEVKEDSSIVKEKISSGVDTAMDGAKAAKDKAWKEGKKAKEKSGGFLSGLIKGAKHAADEISGDVKDFVDETKKEAMEEEARGRVAASEKSKQVEIAAESGKSGKGKVKSAQRASDSGKAGSERDAGRIFGEKLSNQAGQRFIAVSSDPKSAVAEFLEEMKRDSAWDKVHFQHEPDVHLYENVDTMFVKERKEEGESREGGAGKHEKESKKSATKVAYSVFDPLSELDSEARVRLSEREIEDSDGGGESMFKKVSRIPQRVSSSTERVSPSSSSDSSSSTVRILNVFRNVEHLEPRTRQTVTTVVTKSVRTATTHHPVPPSTLTVELKT